MTYDQEMAVEIITDRPDLLIRRTTLQPGEATPWHIDACDRFTVVVRGERIRIEFEAPNETAVDVSVTPGQADWDEPTATVHRAVNVGAVPFEEVVTFFRTAPDQDPQPTPG